MKDLETKALFVNEETKAPLEFLKGFKYPWEAVLHIKDFVCQLGKRLPRDEYEEITEGVWISKKAKVYKSACILPPTVIEDEAEVRHCAFIRGGVFVGKGAVVGNSTELKNAILFDYAQAPHFNYVGDSILGYRAHLGAGAITSNVKSDKSQVRILGKIDTGFKKLGAILGDFAEIGCGTVLNPGTIVGERASVYPLCSVRGFVPKNHIYKGKGEIIEKV